MQLTLEQVRNIACGVASVEQEAEGICFYRFTPEQMELYRLRSEEFYRKAKSASGVRLRFRTDSRQLTLRGEMFKQTTSRTYYSLDIFADGKLVDTVDNYAGFSLPGDYVAASLPVGEFSKTVELGEGTKEICLYLPWNKCVALRELSLDDGAAVEPVKPSKTLLCFGDSITQGYDALRPSNRYASQLADWLEAEEYNKAIGGEVFFPELAKTKESFVPDYITVAYGTNDWRKTTFDVFQENCRQFYENLSRTYPDTPIYAITPIWRKNQEALLGNPPFACVEEYICEVAKTLPNVKVLRGYDMVPHDESYFADFVLHPNDKGYAEYFFGLKKAIGDL